MTTVSSYFKLEAEQLEHFDREGYLIVEDLFTDDELQPVIDEITGEVDASAREQVAAGKLSRTFEEDDFEHRLASISAETDQVALSIWSGTLAGPAIFDLIRNVKLLDIAEQMCGDELIASSVYRLRPKVPHFSYGAVPWHQDSGYTEPFCDDKFMLTVWIPLVDATPERGCMWVQPRVHKGPVLTHVNPISKAYLEIPASEMPDVPPVCVPVRKGGALLLTNRTPHVSFENTSDIVRWSMDLRYQSAKLPTNATISRLPGEMVASIEAGIPLACYPPEADFLVRSKLRPTEVVTEASVFHDIRHRHLAQPITSRWSAAE